ncbi:MAG: BrnA antitoxin family protein [Paludibacterium sp.]|uniref:BrnA antitoxin family protein n=1 Tax=Paludibacterium sp. TaxID=1917523 RepID=UPI0025E1866D|nr:BrnA antitoxin family protein [Paludibacterium sp.]MBV8045985.1 BrnA antitoxin family protein [Paludibacterium sp.]MBV8648906.1 BrnA antitoxin family protein [Paludibacterium sp.]
MPQTIKTRGGRILIVPPPEEDAVINAGIAADPDTFEPTDEELKTLRPVRGRPKSAHPKRTVTIRLDADIAEAFQRGGSGWQTRINQVLKDYMHKR